MLHAPAIAALCAGGLRALQTLPPFCAPRECDGGPHETAQPARSMWLAVRGQRLVNSVVLVGLSCSLAVSNGGHGPRESGQSRARGHRSAVGVCQHCPRTLGLRPIGRHSSPSSSPRRAASPCSDRGGRDRAGRACGSVACTAAQAACVERGALNARLAKPLCVARLSHATSEASIAGRSR